jgi:hypothetical protein
MLYVSMPTFQTPRHLLDRAVRSVLTQTHRDLRLVVVNDGGPPLGSMPKDKRLLVVNLPENRGRYYADAVVTEAVGRFPGSLWSVHDSDDWSEPDRFENLLPHAGTGAVLSSYWRERPRGGKFVQQPLTGKILSPRPGFVHLSHWVSGIYSLDRVVDAGGIHPGFRVGFDTLFVRMVAMTGVTNVVDLPAYHWCRRASGSLTTTPATKFGSPARVTARDRLRRLDDLAWASKADPGQVIRQDVDPSLQDQVATDAAKVADRLSA